MIAQLNEVSAKNGMRHHDNDNNKNLARSDHSTHPTNEAPTILAIKNNGSN